MKKIILLVTIALGIVGFLYGGSSFVKQQRNTPGQLEKTTDIAKDVKTPCSGKVVSEQTEGPYYKTNSPRRNVLYEESIPGEKITLRGVVLDTSCQPIANAWVDFWQADGNGEYDNEGYTLRGHQFTDENGTYSLESVVPGEYPGRTPHIHVKLRATKGTEIVTTQLYIPGNEKNNGDAIFDESLLMEYDQDSREATYTFIIARN